MSTRPFDLTNTSLDGRTYWADFKIYVSRVKEFTRVDWLIYLLWVGLMAGLASILFIFFFWGSAHGVSYPVYVWNIPIGALIFCTAIAIDTIGHRTVYKEELRKGESLVHGITIFCGMTSVMLLCMAKDYPEALRFPALVLIALSFLYSIIDEALHWVRYLKQKSDRIEMWSHFGIFLGHTLFILTWWHWFEQGYPAVEATFETLPF